MLPSRQPKNRRSEAKGKERNTLIRRLFGWSENLSFEPEVLRFLWAGLFFHFHFYLSFAHELSTILVVDRTWLVHCASLRHIIKPENWTNEIYFRMIFDSPYLFSDSRKPCILFDRVKLLFWESVSGVLSNLGNHSLGILLHRLKPEQSQIWVVLTLPACWWTEILNSGSGSCIFEIVNRI